MRLAAPPGHRCTRYGSTATHNTSVGSWRPCIGAAAARPRRDRPAGAAERAHPRRQGGGREGRRPGARLGQQLRVSQRPPGGRVVHAQQVRADGDVAGRGRPARAQLRQQALHDALEAAERALSAPHLLPQARAERLPRRRQRVRHNCGRVAGGQAAAATAFAMSHCF